MRSSSTSRAAGSPATPPSPADCLAAACQRAERLQGGAPAWRPAGPAPRGGAARLALWGGAACSMLGLWWALSAAPSQTDRALPAAQAADAAAPSGMGQAGAGRSAPGTAPGAFPWAALCGGAECAEAPPAAAQQEQQPHLHQQQPHQQQQPTLASNAPLPWAADPEAWALHPEPVAPVAAPERPRFNTPTVPDEFDSAPGVDSDLSADAPVSGVDEVPAS